jgi:hypothetical protein
MSYNRLTYDNCAYSTEIKESTSSLEYNLFVGKYENCKQYAVKPYGRIPNIKSSYISYYVHVYTCSTTTTTTTTI